MDENKKIELRQKYIKAKLRTTVGAEGEVYGYECLCCGTFWKIYPNEYHAEECVIQLKSKKESN